MVLNIFVIIFLFKSQLLTLPDSKSEKFYSKRFHFVTETFPLVEKNLIDVVFTFLAFFHPSGVSADSIGFNLSEEQKTVSI